jgi:hypothetical protein
MREREEASLWNAQTKKGYHNPVSVPRALRPNGPSEEVAACKRRVDQCGRAGSDPRE